MKIKKLEKLNFFIGPILECINVSKIYNDGGKKINIIKNITFSVEKGEMIGIIGKSGAGKSTLLNILGGFDKPSSGLIKFNGKEIYKFSSKYLSFFRNQHLGFIYQFHYLLRDFSILENVAMPLLIKGLSYAKAKKDAKNMLILVGLAGKEKCFYSNLSGGERQKVSIARALVNNPSLVLADEPTGNLDEKSAKNILDLIFFINKKYNTSFLIVTHDLKLSKNLHRRLIIEDGKLIMQDYIN